jgi:Domain of unknown function (DUF4351)
MSQFPHDEFAKDLLSLLLEAYGRIEVERTIGSEARAIDFCFFPALSDIPTEHLGILSRLAAVAAGFEPYRNPASAENVRDCLGKLYDFRKELRRQNKKAKVINPVLPSLWIMTPTMAPATLKEFGAIIDSGIAKSGVYRVSSGYKAGIVVIHQLPRTPDTLWLRLLGRDNVQTEAIEETYGLSKDSPYRKYALELLSALQNTLGNKRKRNKIDQELFMSLLTSPLYIDHVRKLTEQGKADEARSIAHRLLTKKFVTLPTDLQAAIDNLSIDQTSALIDALLDFGSIDDLQTWLLNVS